MARMFPDVPAIAAESAAEQRLYNLFKSRLPDDFAVYHSVSYVLSGGRSRRPRRGEADFVIVHRELGLLVVEVKGGGVGFDPEHGRWYSHGRQGMKPIKDPFQQAQRCLEDLEEAIRRSRLLGSNLEGLVCGYCVALPDCEVAGTPLPAWGTPELVIDATHLDQLAERVVEIMRGFGRQPAPIPTGVFRALQQQVLARYFDLGLKLTGEIEWEKQALALLTEDQSICLDFLGLNPKCLVRGPAGTGKTVIAIEHAHRLACQGGRVLLVCYNLPLASYLRNATRSRESGQRIWAGAYHELCRAWVERAGLEWREPQEEPARTDFWDMQSTLLLLEAMKAVPERFDHLVVDEAQDLHPDWWSALLQLLRDADSASVVAFCDPYQNIYRRPEAYPVERPIFPLRTNCRNTRLISEFFLRLMGVRERFPIQGAAGREPCIRRYRTQEEEVQRLEGDLYYLICESGIAPERIVILGTHRLERSCLAGKSSLAGLPLISTEPWPDGPRHSLHYSTLHRYKGLEADFVMFCDIDGNERTCTPHHIYVGASRARHRLYLYVAADVHLPGL
jgi:hypothetical protein